jgi:integrase
MQKRFRLYRRGQNGCYYIHDGQTGKQKSLGTTDKTQAMRLLHVQNEAYVQPAVNLQIARAYLMASDSLISKRTWQHVMNQIVDIKTTEQTKRRWMLAIKDHAFDSIRNLPILQTTAEQLLKSIHKGTVATNVFLRQMQNFAVDMNWLPWPIISKKTWPKARFKGKRAITSAEHQLIVDREKNPERHAYYQLAWYLGASQADLANLHAEDVDWSDKIISFERAKTRWRGGQPPQVRFGVEVEAILNTLPNAGPLFPYLRSVRSGDRATEFKQRCDGLGIQGVSLHSYRYAWAERAKTCGYPERFAQQALGHNSKAVHRAYARKAKVIVPSLEDYERAYRDGKIIHINMQKALAAESGTMVKDA